MLSFSGEFTMPRPPGDIYAFLVAPHRLVTCLPEVIRYEVKDQDHFTVTLRVGIGRVRGPLSMRMEITEKREGSYARILGKGSMVKSQISIDGDFTLSDAEEGTTRVRWTGNARIGTFLMQLIGSHLDQLVRENLQQFVQTLQAQIAQETLSG
ncbi:MAG: SRPBCC family protein [Chloroflexi bacterium]|nr:SRPBCC family protein [Chloroflexota bacterium]